MALWNQQSAVTLRPAQQVPESERRRSAILTFADHEAPDDEFTCASWVGYQPRGGTQEIYINPGAERPDGEGRLDVEVTLRDLISRTGGVLLRRLPESP